MHDMLTGAGLLTVAGSKALDDWAVASGDPLYNYMERAGKAVADAVFDYSDIPQNYPDEICVLCGPGNNGGDGYVAARYLKDRGYNVFVMAPEPPTTDEASKASSLWLGETIPFKRERLEDVSIVVDALFGIGLSRPIEGVYADAIRAANGADVFRLAVDVASGLDADAGVPVGEVCFSADATITFTRAKPGQYLAPGRFISGGTDHIKVADIGFPEALVHEHASEVFENDISLWGHTFPFAGPSYHKYDRGHLLVLGGREPALGASRLASLAGLRIGAGLVTLAAPSETYTVQASSLTDIMVRKVDSHFGFIGILADQRINTTLIGPGSGIGEKTAELALECLKKGKRLTLDADGLSSMAGRLQQLDAFPKREAVFTPHDGEFRRLFPDIDLAGNRLAAAQTAAKRAGVTIILKGVSTIVASPDGKSAINTCAPAWLSVGGTGDVLAGIVAGLLAQGMPVFEASCAAVWLHSRAAMKAGRGLIASDLLETLVDVLP